MIWFTGYFPKTVYFQSIQTDRESYARVTFTLEKPNWNTMPLSLSSDLKSTNLCRIAAPPLQKVLRVCMATHNPTAHRRPCSTVRINYRVRQCLPRFADLKRINALCLRWLFAIWTRASLHKATADNGFESRVHLVVQPEASG